MLLSLHSTMFLLIQPQKVLPSCYRLSLHSTMFLLIHGTQQAINNVAVAFTFHYVSINTKTSDCLRLFLYTLHSTMFLLIQNQPKRCKKQ